MYYDDQTWQDHMASITAMPSTFTLIGKLDPSGLNLAAGRSKKAAGRSLKKSLDIELRMVLCRVGLVTTRGF